jgi:hypothetical protein
VTARGGCYVTGTLIGLRWSVDGKTLVRDGGYVLHVGTNLRPTMCVCVDGGGPFGTLFVSRVISASLYVAAVAYQPGGWLYQRSTTVLQGSTITSGHVTFRSMCQFCSSGLLLVGRSVGINTRVALWCWQWVHSRGEWVRTCV